MPLSITPDTGIPLPDNLTPEEIKNFRKNAHVLFNTVQELVYNGLEVEVTDEDHRQAITAFTTEEIPSPKVVQPGSIIALESILCEYDKEVLDMARRLRTYVTNKLVMETVDPDAKVRIKALELLGKISNVGLFSNNIDVTITHRSTADIERELKRVLESTGVVIDVTPEDEKPLSAIDLDEELGRLNADA